MFHMKRTTLMLDESLLDEALRLSGEKSYSAVVRLAVADLVRRIRARRILSLRGSGLWRGRLEDMRGDTVGDTKATRGQCGKSKIVQNVNMSLFV